MQLDTDRATSDIRARRNPSYEARERPRRLLRVFAGLILICAFDFKAESSGSAALLQGSVYLMYLFLLGQILVVGVRQQIAPRKLLVLLVVVTLFLADSSLVGLYHDQSPYFIFTNCLAPFIYASAAVATFIVLRAAREHLAMFLSVIRLACLSFGAIHFFLVLWVKGGIDLSQSRYEWLNSAVVPSLGLIAVAIVCRLRRADLLVLMVQLAIAIISVTRTLVLVIVAQVAAVFVARPSLLRRRATLRPLAILCMCAVTLWGIDIWTGAGLSNRWVDRMTVSERFGYDPTALTRNAETEYMLQAFSASTTSVLFGNGLAAYTWSIGRDAIIIGETTGWGNVNSAEIGIGHEDHVSILFVAGILGGGGLLLVQFFNVILAITLIRRLTANLGNYDDDFLRVGVWGAVTVIGVYTLGFLGGTINDRPTCLWYGIGTGMLYWVWHAAQTPNHSG